jgi:hypothetical protein
MKVDLSIGSLQGENKLKTLSNIDDSQYLDG